MKQLTEKEWVEAFEEINGRKPSPEEFMEGMKSGEFDISDEQQLSSEKWPLSPASDLYRNILEQLHRYRHILYIVLSFLGLVLFFVFLQSNRISFDESNFEDGTWVVMRKERNYEVHTVTYMTGTWDELFINSKKSTDWFEYESIDEFRDSQKLKDKPVELPSIDKIKKSMESITGLENLNSKNFMVISKGDVHTVFYWLNKDRAVIYIPVEEKAYVAQKLNTTRKISGEYQMRNIVIPSMDEKKDELLKNKEVYSFDDYTRTTSNDVDTFGVLSVQQFLEIYQLAGGNLKEIKDIDEINQVINQVGKKIENLNNAEVIIEDYGNDGFSSNVVNTNGLAWFTLLALPVDRGDNILLITPGASEEVKEAYGRKEASDFSKMIAELEIMRD